MTDRYVAFRAQPDITAFEVAQCLDGIFVERKKIEALGLLRHTRPMTEPEKNIGRAQGIPQEQSE